MPTRDTLRHLAGLYAGSADPWNHAASDYERGKHARTAAVAGPGPFREALELGCGNGVLAARLAPRSARLTAVECVGSAAALARARLASAPNVSVVEADAVHCEIGRPDLVVLSEILYFLVGHEIDALAARIVRSAAPGCRLVSVNWRGTTGEALDGTQAAERLVRGLSMWRLVRHVHQGYLLDVFDAPGARQGAAPAARVSRARSCREGRASGTSGSVF